MGLPLVDEVLPSTDLVYGLVSFSLGVESVVADVILRNE